MYHLSKADPAHIKAAIAEKLPLQQRWHHYASRTGYDTIGQLGERIVRQAFEGAPQLFFVAPGWGDVKYVNGKNIPADGGRVGSVDGLVMLSDVPPAQGSAIIEVKNQREWVYPRDAALWDVIRNGFAVGAVPVIFARKIYQSAFTYVLGPLGGIGIQMHAQFVPASVKDDLEMCQNRLGLGFKDLDFNEVVPRSLTNAIAIIASQIDKSRRRMAAVTELVSPHLDTLANDAQPKTRYQQYEQVQEKLRSIGLVH